MSKKPIWIKWWPKDALDGTMTLAPMEELAYRRILDLIYSTGDNLPDDDKRLAWMTKTGSKWPAIKKTLISLDKIAVVDGQISNAKCRDILRETDQLFAQKSEAGTASAAKRKSLKTQKSRPTGVGTNNPTDVPTHQNPDISPNGDSPPDPPQNSPLDLPADPQPDELQIALAEYNQTAKQVGWPVAAKFDEDRRRKLRQRLNDAGGLAGWRQALIKASASNHCRGQNSRGWVLSLDFLLQASSFTKLMEGNYDNRRPIAAQPAVNRREYDPDESRRRTLEAFPDLVGRDCGAFTGPGH